MILFWINNFKRRIENHASTILNLKHDFVLSLDKNKQKGVSLIIVLFIMIIILGVTVSISTILYSELKVIRNIGNSIVGFYAADSGIEKILYYDKQVLPIVYSTPTTDCTVETVDVDCADFPDAICDTISNHCATYMARGLCAMLDLNNNNYCSVQPSSPVDTSVYCNGPTITLNDDVNYPNGCDPDTCDNCTITFNSTLDNNGTTAIADDKIYTVEALVDPSTYYLDIKAGGSYGGAERKIEIYNNY